MGHDRRSRTGTIDPFKRADGTVYYRSRIRLGDGSWHRVRIEEPFCDDKEDARKYTATIQVEEDAHGRILKAKRGELVAPNAPAARNDETVRNWHSRWVASRVAKGNTSTRDDKSRFLTHIDPLIGERLMASIERPDIEAIVESLDGKVRAGEMSWHTAWNVWAVVSRMFRDSAYAK